MLARLFCETRRQILHAVECSVSKLCVDSALREVIGQLILTVSVA